MFTGIIIEVPFALGELLLGLEAYYIRDWVTLQLVAYTPVLVLLGLWFLVPESPRWLLATGKYRPKFGTERLKLPQIDQYSKFFKLSLPPY